MLVGGGGLGILAIIAALIFGVDPTALINATSGFQPPAAYEQPYAREAPGGAGSTQECQTGADANQRADCRAVGFVNSVQDYWRVEFGRRNWQYQPARTVLFSGATQSGCGAASQEQGPFYCPADGKIYRDLTFFRELQSRFGASGGPFAEAYVIAHEYGHHVQHQLGLIDQGAQRDAGAQGGAVRIELQADCLAGVWTRHAASTGYLQAPSETDIRDALSAAAAVGDDRLQKMARGRVQPESWSHGSSEQRMTWFNTGYKSGDPNACNTRTGRV